LAKENRALSKICAAEMENLCPDLPGLPPLFFMQSTIASYTDSGFGHEVAALSK